MNSRDLYSEKRRRPQLAVEIEWGKTKSKIVGIGTEMPIDLVVRRLHRRNRPHCFLMESITEIRLGS
jgi:hypothetical protein